ncbi:sigma-54-dependent transcriptional regulator [Marinomonas mediterranea]|jgi:Response regulator containing CheY-like receiver, AAA-type ATPase, and DNA-binding domains|uniref:Two component, sigma54 specific, transcriptional regulator, Fis family n=1 Tax=Marinomonas mediterranea (strain ATCC 700492 / JCM 21426 / NBRC 103028 / MMB-1) TaxID=717774 RepID=F2K3L7_MARM1|nr:sigma-54 dependent transcriptional regulator [Marinomonas mediterranea]ADZ92456.1 two component, sigma54 specific, transcriptional regulator, Fis family [Marinomonas mediterranea MMB-1]WCN10406.1 response regulator [Marinomonas mediterranea]WCN14452.1 response regulator [Marinomonas mediterranea]WCN18504.1 response regulator [Marinomonas mediterranea MMB-1]
MNKVKLLVVEDDRGLAEALEDTLLLAGYDCSMVGSSEEAILSLKKQSYDMVVSDINLPGMDGYGLLKHVTDHYPELPIMLMTAYGDIAHAVEAMREGAVDYLLKPFEEAELLEVIQKHTAGALDNKSSTLIAVDPSSKAMVDLAKRVAVTDSTVLICGESGTGKEVLANYIHTSSDRVNQPFVAINCAAIPENMLEAILFGYEKGAYTGAVSSQAGKFEQANGGSILLDEITEMDVGLQAKLLRVLQEQEVERLGGKKPIKLDVRIIATTNRDLASYVKEGGFREDLYYRLNVFPLKWSPIRERKGDIIPIAESLLKKHAVKMRLGEVVLMPSAQSKLESHRWPGNVRELDNVIQRALILCSGSSVEEQHVVFDMLSSEQVVEPESQLEENEDAASILGKGVQQHEFRIIAQALIEAKGKRKDVAEKLGISPRTLRYKIAKMREFGLEVD